MFRSVKFKNIRLTVFCLICVSLFVAVCFLALRSGYPDTVTIHGESYPLKVHEEADVERFLEECGHEAPEPVFTNEITVPKHWNAIYQEYNELQRQQGFDLVPYKGKRATEYVYFISEGRNVTVLVAHDRIIAAHSCDVDGSEMQLVIP